MAPFFKRKNAATPEPEPEQAPATTAAKTENGDPEEVSPLADRLRHMDWPTPSEDVRERCLQQIMTRVGDAGTEPPTGAGETPDTGTGQTAG